MNSVDNSTGFIKCEVCDFSTEIVKEFIKHIVSNHSKDYFETEIGCNACSYTTKSQAELQVHLRCHVQFSCDFCNQTFSLHEDLRQHVYNYHPEAIKLNTISSLLVGNDILMNFLMECFQMIVCTFGTFAKI